METVARSYLPRLAYGTLFVVVVPLSLALWAHGTDGAIALPALHSSLWGGVMAAFGVLVMALGMLSLWHDGGGLPMNAFPPPRFVERGIYGLVPHPIYGGFVIACAGVATFTGSASGQWLVTPTVALACAALVLGYELPDLRKRFGARESFPWLPRDQAGPPSWLERVRVYLIVLFPWLAFYELIGVLGSSAHGISTYLPFESRFPVIEQAEVIYFSTYAVVELAPLLLPSGRLLRRFAWRSLIAMAIVFPLYLLLPFEVPPRPFDPSTLIGQLLMWERTPRSGIGAFPSFHVLWACIAASVLGQGGRARKLAWWTWAALVAISCILTGMHSIADVLAGATIFLLITRIRQIWLAILRVAERIANMWQERRMGPVRIINHGGFAAAAALVGIWVIDAQLGPGRAWIAASIFLCSIVGAALWAQWVEGSPALLRPLGFYGGMLGAAIGAGSALLLGINLWIVFAAICLAAPWIQALGRLRCLVQGCCHGRAAQDVPGIRYTHPRSRVCRLAHLAGVPVHATPVYSILWNAVTGAALLRLLQLHASATLICGAYLLLSSAGRFVEEAYRGEPQTPIPGGLHLYQWIAIAAFVAGAAVTCIRSSAVPQFFPMRISSMLLAVACAAATWFVTGVDFPGSSRRFARLT